MDVVRLNRLKQLGVPILLDRVEASEAYSSNLTIRALVDLMREEVRLAHSEIDGLEDEKEEIEGDLEDAQDAAFDEDELRTAIDKLDDILQDFKNSLQLLQSIKQRAA